MYEQQQQQHVHERLCQQHWDAESLSVLCFCLSMWNVPATQSWKAAVAAQSPEVLPQADGPSIIRLGLYLSKLFAGDSEGEQEQLPWQLALRLATVRLMSHGGEALDSQQLVPPSTDSTMASSVSSTTRGMPGYALALLYTGIMHHQPFVDDELLQLLVTAVKSAVEQRQVTMWDVFVVLPAIEELCMALAQSDPACKTNMEQLLHLQQIQFLRMDAEKLIQDACRLRGRAPAVVIQQLPAVASSLGLQIPRNSAAA